MTRPLTRKRLRGWRRDRMILESRERNPFTGPMILLPIDDYDALLDALEASQEALNTISRVHDRCSLERIRKYAAKRLLPEE